MALRLRQNLLNVALVIVALVLIAVVVATRRRVTTSEQEARPNNVLAAWRDDDISRIERSSKDGKLVLEKRGSGDAGDKSWFIVEPMLERAEDFAVDKLSGSLEYATWVRRIKPEEVDRAAFGLDAPRWVMQIDMGNIHYRLALGKEAVSPAGSAYLEVTGQNVARTGIGIVTKELVGELDIAANELRSREVVPYLSTQLSRLVLEGAGGTRRLRSADWKGWRFDGMQGDVRVSREALDRVLLQFARTKADKFIDPATAERALAGQQTVRITLTHRDAKRPRAVVEIGGVCPNGGDAVVALRREPDRLAGCAPRNVMPGLSTPADELVDHGLFTLRPDEVEKLTLVDGARRLEIDRRESGFQMRAPQSASVDLEAGNHRIEALIAARGSIVDGADTKKLDLDPPHGSVTVKSSGINEQESREEMVLVGTTGTDGAVHVQRKHDGAVLKLSREAARALAADTLLLRSTKIFDHPASAFRSVELKLGDVTERLVRGDSGNYVLELPKGFDVDAGLASDLVETLRSLSADRWAAERDDGGFGFDRPTLEAHVSFAASDSGPPIADLVVGAAASGGAYAMLRGDPAVFVLPNAELEKLRTLLIDRGSFVLVRENTLGVSIEARGKKLELAKEADHFVQKSGGEPLTAARIDQIVDALASMRAEAAIETGPAKPDRGFSKPELTVRIRRETSGTEARSISYRIGAGDSWRTVSIHYARAEGIDATFVIARSKVRQLLDAL